MIVDSLIFKILLVAGLFIFSLLLLGLLVLFGLIVIRSILDAVDDIRWIFKDMKNKK